MRIKKKNLLMEGENTQILLEFSVFTTSLPLLRLFEICFGKDSAMWEGTKTPIYMSSNAIKNLTDAHLRSHEYYISNPLLFDVMEICLRKS